MAGRVCLGDGGLGASEAPEELPEGPLVRDRAAADVLLLLPPLTEEAEAETVLAEEAVLEPFANRVGYVRSLSFGDASLMQARTRFWNSRYSTVCVRIYSIRTVIIISLSIDKIKNH